MKMPFGKHKDKGVENCPREYLEWLLGQHESGEFDLRQPLLGEIQRVLGKWNGMAKPRVNAAVVDTPFADEEVEDAPPWDSLQEHMKALDNDPRSPVKPLHFP